MSETHTKSSYAVVQSYILDDPTLDPGAVNLFARISMYSQEGRCWATNRHFSEKHRVDSRTIQRWLSQLTKAGYIEIELNREGIQTTRNIWIQGGFKEKFAARNACHPPKKPVSRPPDAHAVQISINKININKTTSPRPSIHKTSEPKTKEEWRGFFSKMKDEEFEMGWREYEAQPKGSVKSLKAWLPAVVKRLNLVVDQKIEISKMIAKRSETAHRWDGLKNSSGDMVTALRDRVEFTDGPHYKAVRYDVSQEEWSKQTGWKE